MKPPKKYASPAAFKVALEDRLKKRAAQRCVPLNRMRQRFVMERFLARVVRAAQETTFTFRATHTPRWSLS